MDIDFVSIHQIIGSFLFGVQGILNIAGEEVSRVQFESEIKELDDTTRVEIGQRIQEARIRKGLSGEDLGAYLGIKGNQVSRIETGKAKCSLEHIFVIAQVLNCTTDYLLYGKNDYLNFSPEQVDLVKRLYQSVQS